MMVGTETAAGGIAHEGMAGPDAPAAIEARELRHVYRSRRVSVEAVAGVSLRMGAGEVFGFLGPNGAGKTTTLRMLATLLPVTDGEATVAGLDLRREPKRVRERIGYVSQRGGSGLAGSGRDELEFQGRLYSLSAAAATRRAAELITTLELERCAERPPRTYSGGERRRLDVALGLVHSPRLLLLDEPTTGLDPQGRARLWEEVRRLRTSGVAILLTTHYMEEADALCDRVAIIDGGRIVAEGRPDALKRQIGADLVTVGVASDPEAACRRLAEEPYVREASVQDGTIRLYVDHGESAVPAILRLLDGAGQSLQTVAFSRPSLDDVFLRKTGRPLRDGAIGSAPGEVA